jgi:hypothetical protein
MNDRVMLRLVIFILAMLGALAFCSTAAASRIDGLVAGDYCDPDDGQASWTRAEKQRTRDRIARACALAGGSPNYCEFWQAAITRESWGGVASAVHTRGTDVDGEQEYGLGALGLSRKWHRDKWPGDDELPAFCTPEAAFLVGHAIAMRAIVHYHAETLVEIQAVYGGGSSWRRCTDAGLPAWLRHFGLGWLVERTAGRRTCSVIPQRRHYAAVCDRLPVQICTAKISRADLGGRDDLLDRVGGHWRVSTAGRAWALDLAARAP